MNFRAEGPTRPAGRVALLALTILLVGCADGPTVVPDPEVSADFSHAAVAGADHLYFTTWFPGTIWSANLDGSRVVALVHDEPGRPKGIGFDVPWWTQGS